MSASETPQVPPASSRLITWSGYLGLTVLLTLPLSVLIVRSGAWQQGLLLYALACAGATLLLVLFAILSLLPKFSVWRSTLVKQGLMVIPGTLLFISVLAGSGDYPPIHDITTDTVDPPTFSAALAVRGEANPLTIEPDTLAAQIQFYPEIKSLRNGDSQEKNFERALATAKALGWEIYHADAETGVIEAVDTTALMAFKDDIVVRVRAKGSETLIDLRSVSRVGKSDLGLNAKRILEFQGKFQP